MDWLIVALIAGAAFWLGSAVGFHNGVRFGEAQERIRARLETLTKPWIEQ